ncbi:hypothetical protein Avbf_10765 [Armadillidium vulgare]|nr:hypothetical protein Avbf_10765 [Armadillidium vulgare]
MFSTSKLLWISFILLIFIGSCMPKPDPSPNPIANPDPGPDASALPEPRRGGGSRVHRNHRFFRIRKRRRRLKKKRKKRRRYNPYGTSVIKRQGGAPVRRPQD